MPVRRRAALRPRPGGARRQHEARRRAATGGCARSSACWAARTRTAPAAATPWGTWITCEEIFADGAGGVPARLRLRGPARGTDGPVAAVPIKAAGRFSHEAVAWLRGVAVPDRGPPGRRVLPLPARAPAAAAPATWRPPGGTLQALVVPGRPRLDMNTVDARGAPRRRRGPRSAIPTPRRTPSGRRPASRARRSSRARRAPGPAGGRVFFDCTTGGEAGLGQLWEYRPRGRDRGELRLVYESTNPGDLEHPDNLTVVPDDRPRVRDGGRRRRAVRARRSRGAARSTTSCPRSSTARSCAAAASAATGGRSSSTSRARACAPGETPAGQPDARRALTYAIWGPFGRALAPEAPPGGAFGAARVRVGRRWGSLALALEASASIQAWRLTWP